MFGEGFIDAHLLLNSPLFIAENVFHAVNIRDYVVSADDWLPTVGTFLSVFHNFLQ